jgi:hypothetical protein
MFLSILIYPQPLHKLLAVSLVEPLQKLLAN